MSDAAPPRDPEEALLRDEYQAQGLTRLEATQRAHRVFRHDPADWAACDEHLQGGVCPYCYAKGSLVHAARCPACEGFGAIVPTADPDSEHPCSECGGSGEATS